MPLQAAAAPSKARTRELKKRHIVVNDQNSDSIPEIHVAAGVPTTLVFSRKVVRAQLADVAGSMFPATVNGTEVILAAKQDLATSTALPLTVGLSDNTLLSFQLTTVPTEVDLQVEIDVEIEKNAAADSPQALRLSNAQRRAQLDECQANTSTAGAAHIASLVLNQDTASPQMRTFEGHTVHALDKQARLLVEARYLYRLFGLSYLLLTVENRDPTKPWVLERPELKLAGDRATSEVHVTTFDTDLKGGLPPGEQEKVVVVFDTPQQQLVGQRYSVVLYEKGGGRHVKLEFTP
jgi:uncharacterized protein (TIGR02268 family)